MRLSSGRGLSYAEYGALEGLPVVYCHGFPGSRLEAAIADRCAFSLGARIIAIDRPGFGASEICPGRTIPGWADDVRDLADHLGLGEFSVLGVSGGAPYALACAYRLPRRIRRVAIVSGLGPPESVHDTSPTSISGLGLRVTATLPWLASVLSIVVCGTARYASPLLLAMLNATISGLDRRTLNEQALRAILVSSVREAFRTGARGAAVDLRLLGASWGFELDRLAVPVLIWHGEKDRIVPAAMGRYLERVLPTCRAVYLEEHGHYSLVHDCVEQILSRLID